MPAITDEQMALLLDELKDAKFVAHPISKEDKEKASKECSDYFENSNKNINDMMPLSIYYIISQLTEEKQIQFIKENIKFIKEHDEDIFMYDSLCPQALSYFFSLNTLREIHNIDKEIFEKIIHGNHEGLVNGFTHDDYYMLYTEFENELSNIDFVDILDFHNRCRYSNFNIDVDNANSFFGEQRNYNKEFMVFLLDKFQDKISTFNSRHLLRFIDYIEDIEIYKRFINENYDKLKIAFINISEVELLDYLSDRHLDKQEILIFSFYENIIEKLDITKAIYGLNANMIIKLFNYDQELFSQLTLNDWLKMCSQYGRFNDNFKKIIDTFEINDIESLFDTFFVYIACWPLYDVTALKYIETKYRNSIQLNGVIKPINKSTSIFSKEYFKNLSEIKEKLNNKAILKNDKVYKDHLANFILFLQNSNIINNIEDNNFKEIEKLFYKIVKGYPISILCSLSSIEEITILNRLGDVDFEVNDFTVLQLENYNVKQHRQLCKPFEKSFYINRYKKLILKLMFMVGFKNAKMILAIDDTLPNLEHLVGNVDIKNIALDEHGQPILNTKIMNLLFNEKDHTKIKKMLNNKNSELYKYFPRIFNDWEMILINNKNKSLKTILDFLKSDEISLPPKYYRLEGLFKWIGCKNSIVNETLLLHDQMCERFESTIPRITGTKDNYSYEILKLNDMEGLIVGNETNCCFTVLGNGYSCLKHALTSKNGRILVIRKNDEILAHSWIWRNGDLLCLDNIEISKTIDEVDFFDVYLQVADDIIKKSFNEEGFKDCIKNITIGFTNFDKPIIGIQNYPCFVAKNCRLSEKNFESRLGKDRIFVEELPQPIEKVGYSDSKNVQYLIKGTGKFNLGQCYHNYQDDRCDIMHYEFNCSYSEEYLQSINKKVNALRYLKAEKNHEIEKFKMIDIANLIEVYCNDDWYLIVYNDYSIDEYCDSYDSRAREEINAISSTNQKLIKKIS